MFSRLEETAVLSNVHEQNAETQENEEAKKCVPNKNKIKLQKYILMK